MSALFICLRGRNCHRAAVASIFCLPSFWLRLIMRAMNARPQTPFYLHSGRVPASGLVISLVAGSVISSVLALVYAYFDAIMPFIYFNIVASTLLGFLCGLVTGKLLVRGKVRNNLVGALAGLAVGFVALYVAWAAWPHALFDRFDWDIRFAHLLTSPGSLWANITFINHHGAWKFNGTAPTGFFLWFTWLAEALVIVGMSIVTARGSVAAEPFCESCQHWCSYEKCVLELHGWDSAELKKRLEARDFDYLESLGPRTRNDVNWFRIDLHRCRGCGKTATLTAKNVDLTDPESKGGQKAETVIENLLVTGVDLERLQSISSRPR